MAASYNFIDANQYKRALVTGETFARVFTYQGTDGNPINLNGYAARCQVRKDLKSGVVLEMTTTNSRIVVGTGQGNIAITVSATDTAALVPGNYVYDLEIEHDNVVTRILEGQFQIKQAVTR